MASCVALAALSCRPDSSTQGLSALAGSGAQTMPPPLREAPEPQPSSEEIPILARDAVWGNATAPVTIVVFTDLECPFCADGHRALATLTRHFGHERLRVAVKHCPLAMHPQAVPAARVAQAVLELGGRGRFFQYLDLAYANPETLADGRALELAASLGLDSEAVRELAGSEEIGEQIVEHVELASRLGIAATPHFRINGLPVTGAVPAEALEPVVQAELREAARLRQSGVAANRVYARRVTENVQRPER